MKMHQFIAAGILGCLTGVASAITLSLQPPASVVNQGDSVTLELTISGLANGAAPSLGDFDVDIAFDPSRLSFTGYSLGAMLGDLGLGEALDFSLGDLGGGLVNIAELSFLEPDAATCVFCLGPYLDDIQADSFVLAALDFQVDSLAPGQSTALSLSVNALGDGFGSALDHDTQGATLRRAAGQIPEPASLALLGLGLFGLGLARARLP